MRTGRLVRYVAALIGKAKAVVAPYHILDESWDLFVNSQWEGGGQDERASENVPAPINNSAVNGTVLSKLQDWSSNNVDIDAFIGDFHLNTGDTGIIGNTYDTQASQISYLIGGSAAADPGSLTIDGVAFTFMFLYRADADGGDIIDGKGGNPTPRVVQRGDGRIDFAMGATTYDFHNTGSFAVGYNVYMHTQGPDFVRGYKNGAVVFESLSGGEVPGTGATIRSIFSLDSGSSRLRGDFVILGFKNAVMTPDEVDRAHIWISERTGVDVAQNFSLSTPPEDFIVQRSLDPDSGTGVFHVEGVYRKDDPLTGSFNGGASSAMTAQGFTYSGIITGATGVGSLDVTDASATVSRAVAGVGDVLGADGQSNALGQGGSDVPPSTHDGPILGTLLSPDDIPAITTRTQSQKGHYPAMLTDYTNATGRCLHITATGKGSEPLASFLPDAPPPSGETYNLFDRAARTWITAAGFDPDTYDYTVDGRIMSGIMFMQGETNCAQLVSGYAAATDAYEANLRTYIQARAAQFGVPVFVIVQQDLQTVDGVKTKYCTPEALDAIRTAQLRVRGEVVGFDEEPWALRGPDMRGFVMDGDRNVHCYSQASNAEFGQRWSAAIRSEFNAIVYSGADMVRGPDGEPVVNRV